MSHAPIACTLTADELARGAADLLPGLAGQAASVQPVPDGVCLEFVAKAGVLPRLAAVIERECQCCQFLRFQLDVAPARGPLVLQIDGPPGTGNSWRGSTRPSPRRRPNESLKLTSGLRRRRCAAQL